MDIKEFAKLGGKARWKGISKKKRSEIMSAVSKGRLTKGKKQSRTARSG